MKKQLLVVALGLGAVVMAANAVNAGTLPGTGIRGSRHDLSAMLYTGADAALVVGGTVSPTGAAAGPAVGTGGDDAVGVPGSPGLQRVCIFCHAPHNTIKPGATMPYAPLWNKTVTTLTYDMYSNGLEADPNLLERHKLNSVDDLDGSFQGVSRLCLSCHDGSVGLNSYGSRIMNNDRLGSVGAAAFDGPGAYTAGSKLGNAGQTWVIGGMNGGAGNGDLSNHHPIGFNYNTVAAKDWEIAPADTAFPGTGVKISEVLYGNKMECATCHDVHNSHGGMGEKLLWTSDKNSSFCCTCHLKCANDKNAIHGSGYDSVDADGVVTHTDPTGHTAHTVNGL